MSDEKVFIKQLFVCLGRRYRADGRMEILFSWVDNAADPLSWEYNPKFKRYNPGTVYRIEATEDGGSIRPSTAEVVRIWDDQEQRSEWIMLDQSSRASQAADRESKKEGSFDAILKQMEPLREAYWKTNAANRIAMEVIVLRALRTMPWREKG